jgi:hypothetical protein
MRELEDKEIFHLFQSRLTDTDNFVNDFNGNWADLENQLEQKKNRKRRVIQFYRTLSGIAAMLLLFFGWQMTNDSMTIKKNAVAQAGQSKVLRDKKHKTPEGQHSIDNIHENRGLPIDEVEKSHMVAKKTYPHNPNTSSAPKDSAEKNSLATIFGFKNNNQISPPAQRIRTIDSLHILRLVARSLLDTARYKKPALDQKQKVKISNGQGSGFALAILVAPEMSGTSSLNSVQAGASLSIQLSYRITKKLSISTGVDYSDKPYETTFSSYRGGKTAWWNKTFANKGLPDDVLADCKVLDIPLNINYQVFSKGKNSVMLGSGISSYFMLEENYSFRFSDPLSQGENLDLKNENKHILSVLNLNSTFKHSLNNNFGIIIQPYMKLPLNKIGFGQVNLKSAGIAVGFSWNIRNMLKKK